MAQQTQADDFSTELKEAVRSADGTRTIHTSAPTTKQAADGRWFVEFSTSHSYGRSNAVDAMQDVLPAMELNYSPHGATQWAAERVPEGERPSEDEAQDLVQEGLVYVNQRGYTAEVQDADYFLEVEYPDSQFGDSRTEPKADRLAEELKKGTVAVLEDPREGEDKDGGHEATTELGASVEELVGDERIMTDGGVVVEDGGLPQDEAATNPHQHRTVWTAAANLETHEDGSAPRVGVEYRQKNGNGTARKAGTVEQIEVERPDDTWGEGVEQPTPRIVFQRDDGQQMYVEPDGLYTVGSHAPYVGAVVSLTTSTTSTVEQPEGDSSQEQGDTSANESGGQATRAARTPDWRQAAAENQPDHSGLGAGLAHALAEWAEGQDGLHAEVGTTCYSWDIPGFGRQNDPHSGRTAKEGGDCVYVEVRGPRSEAQEKALAEVCHEFDVEASTSTRRATLVPSQGGF